MEISTLVDSVVRKKHESKEEITITRTYQLSIPQSGKENHQNDDKLKDFNFIEDANAVMILEILNPLL
jgi:hypothetical protein